MASPTLTESTSLEEHHLLRKGCLKNGLKYRILPNQYPKGRVQAFLQVHTGSLSETDEQRGMAHFVE